MSISFEVFGKSSESRLVQAPAKPRGASAAVNQSAFRVWTLNEEKNTRKLKNRCT